MSSTRRDFFGHFSRNSDIAKNGWVDDTFCESFAVLAAFGRVTDCQARFASTGDRHLSRRTPISFPIATMVCRSVRRTPFDVTLKQPVKFWAHLGFSWVFQNLAGCTPALLADKRPVTSYYVLTVWGPSLFIARVPRFP